MFFTDIDLLQERTDAQFFDAKDSPDDDDIF